MCGVAAAATHALLSSSMIVADCFQPSYQEDIELSFEGVFISFDP